MRASQNRERSGAYEVTPTLDHIEFAASALRGLQFKALGFGV